MNTYGLELIRSDTGDGGWSLHDPAASDEEGFSPVLLDGYAQWIDDAWNQPNQGDYDAAEALRKELKGAQP